MNFKKTPTVYTEYLPTLPLDVAKIDSHEFPHIFTLTAFTGKFISYFKPKTGYSVDLFDYLCERASILRYCIYEKEERDNSYTFLYKNCLLHLTVSEETANLSIYHPTGDIFDITEFNDFKVTDAKSRISILVKSSYGLETRSIKIDPLKVVDINVNYGPAFDKVHANVITKINKAQSSIMFFHGPPGCGKSSYIKYLTSHVDKEFIFIPVAFAGELSSPDFMSLLLDHKDSILILEDSEKVVQSRDQDDHNVSTVSTLLNISDGILGSMLNIKIIATYNGDKDKVDKALLRPGRLAIDHTFGKLDPETATKLAKQLGKNITFDKEMSLAEVYNIDDDTGYKEKVTRRIGFCA
jgi:hypothetical protein